MSLAFFPSFLWPLGRFSHLSFSTCMGHFNTFSSSSNFGYSFTLLVFYIPNAKNLAIYIINLIVCTFLKPTSHNFTARRGINADTHTHTPV